MTLIQHTYRINESHFLPTYVIPCNEPFFKSAEFTGLLYFMTFCLILRSKVLVGGVAFFACKYNTILYRLELLTCLSRVSSFMYRTRAIITLGLYLFYLIFHCGLYSREVYIAERLVLQGNFSDPKNPRLHKLLQWKMLLGRIRVSKSSYAFIIFLFLFMGSSPT